MPVVSIINQTSRRVTVTKGPGIIRVKVHDLTRRQRRAATMWANRANYHRPFVAANIFVYSRRGVPRPNKHLGPYVRAIFELEKLGLVVVPRIR